MPNQNDTQTIVIAMREEFKTHSVKMEAFQEQTAKLLKAHSEEIWGTDEENIGIKAKVRDITNERKRESDNRMWWRGAVGIPLIGLSIDKLLSIFTAVHK